jgi:hypothetical protein
MTSGSKLRSFGPLPFAAPIADAQRILGRKARSQVYEAIGRGELDAVKDGGKTLIIVSIIRYCSRIQPAKIKAAGAEKEIVAASLSKACESEPIRGGRCPLKK